MYTVHFTDTYFHLHITTVDVTHMLEQRSDFIKAFVSIAQTLSLNITEDAEKQYLYWAASQPGNTYQLVDFGDDDYHIKIKACYENGTVHDSISLEAYDNATKWLNELDESNFACPIDSGNSSNHGCQNDSETS